MFSLSWNKFRPKEKKAFVSCDMTDLAKKSGENKNFPLVLKEKIFLSLNFLNMNEWMNEWMIEWMNKQMNAGMNEWLMTRQIRDWWLFGHWVWYGYHHSFTHSLTHQPTHSLTLSHTHPLTHSPTHSLTNSLNTPTHQFTHSLRALTRSPAHSLHSLNPPTHSLTLPLPPLICLCH